MTVESPADHLTWEIEAKLTSGQRWKTADDETKAEIALEPRVQDDGTLDLAVIAHSGKQMVQTRFRLKKGHAQTFDLGARLEQDIMVRDEKAEVTREARVPMPKVTVRYL